MVVVFFVLGFGVLVVVAVGAFEALQLLRVLEYTVSGGIS